MVEALVQALKDEDAEVRWAATRFLGEIGDERVVEPLIQALKDEGKRIGAVMYLRKIGEPAVGALIQALRDKHHHVRETAADALGEIGDARAIESLSELERHAKRELREAAKEALEKIKAKKI